jgi:hypothetical protein
MGTTSEPDQEEFGIFALRLFHFMNLWTIYTDLLKQKYLPSLDNDDYPVRMTMMFIVYAYFYSLVEDSSDGVNGFRVCRQNFPEETAAIAAVEGRVKPFLVQLRVFRNRMGFHGSRTTSHESAAFDLFNKHSGMELLEAMKAFKAMSAAFLGLSAAQQANDHDAMAKKRQELQQIAAGF